MAQTKIQSVQLSDSGVTPGPYTSANITVDASGRITFAEDGSGGGSSAPINEIVFGTGPGTSSNSGFTYYEATNSFYVNVPTIQNESSDIIMRSADNLAGFGHSEFYMSNASSDNTSAVYINGGDDTGTGNGGGNLTFTCGNSISGSGGQYNLNAGNGLNGGHATITAGFGTTGFGGEMFISSGGNNSATDYAGNVFIRAAANSTDPTLSGAISFHTNNTNRLELGIDGEFFVNGDEGTSGQILTSGGLGAPATWETAGAGSSLWEITEYTENFGKTTVERLQPLPITAGDRQEVFIQYRTLINSEPPVSGDENFLLATINATSGSEYVASGTASSYYNLAVGAIYNDITPEQYTPILTFISTAPQPGGYPSKIVSVPSGFSSYCIDSVEDLVLVGERTQTGDPLTDSYVTTFYLADNQLGSNGIFWQNRFKYANHDISPLRMARNPYTNFGLNLATAWDSSYTTITGLLTKFDSGTGATQWRREISGADEIYSLSMNPYGAGNSRIFVGVDDSVISLNESGTILWQKQITNMSAFSGPYYVNQAYGLAGNNWVIALVIGSDGCGLVCLDATTGALQYSVNLPDFAVYDNPTMVWTLLSLVVVGEYKFDSSKLITISLDGIGGYQSSRLVSFTSTNDPHEPQMYYDFRGTVAVGNSQSMRIPFELSNNYDYLQNFSAVLTMPVNQAAGTTDLSASYPGLSVTIEDFTSSSPANTPTLVNSSYTIGTPVGITEDNPGYTLTDPTNITTVATRLSGPLTEPLIPSVQITNGLSTGQLQLTGLIGSPTSSTGSLGDTQGMVRADDSYIYYCYLDYDGFSDIWARSALDNGSW